MVRQSLSWGDREKVKNMIVLEVDLQRKRKTARQHCVIAVQINWWCCWSPAE